MFLKHGKKRMPSVMSVVGATLLLTFIAMSTASIAYAREWTPKQVSVTLSHTPYGNAWLKWDPKTEDLTVKTTLTGLAPNSTHPAHIHLGVCTSNGAIAYPLRNVVADAGGNAVATTVIANVKNGIPANGWYINVHNGPNLTPAVQFIPIACGDIHNPDTSLKIVQQVNVPLSSTNAADQAAAGNAVLKLNGTTLTVVVTLHGLVPNSAHAAHIHAGSCQNQVPGSIVYMLKDSMADASGTAVSTTVINGVERIPSAGWYVNVHRSTDLSTQTGFDPIACGNVKMG